MKRYFRLVTEWVSGGGVVYIEFTYDWATRQVTLGDDWAVASDCIHDFIPGVGYALAQEPITEYDLHPEARISAAEFEDAWHFACQSV